MPYIENPKLTHSGLYACIPQKGRCPNECRDCFFQGDDRSYLAPLDENLPNMPNPADTHGFVVRVNDGNDSNINRAKVISSTKCYQDRFFNTAIPDDLGSFPGPVVLTVNPGARTDSLFHVLSNIPPNLMFVRVRTNTWNLHVVDAAVEYYTEQEVPVVLTFMAYFDRAAIPDSKLKDYVFRKRTKNCYWAITTKAWRKIMEPYQDNPWVHSCGKIEGEKGTTLCRHCGNCLREYFATKLRMENVQEMA